MRFEKSHEIDRKSERTFFSRMVKLLVWSHGESRRIRGKKKLKNRIEIKNKNILHVSRLICRVEIGDDMQSSRWRIIETDFFFFYLLTSSWSITRQWKLSIFPYYNDLSLYWDSRNNNTPKRSGGDPAIILSFRIITFTKHYVCRRLE